ncbi:hypothetical protein QEN19_001270 [Hanseniaspora menglaensis]
MSIDLKFTILKGDNDIYNKSLIFDLETYKYIRMNYNIAGKFIGILTDFKQQYNISNLPCEINIFELYWVLNLLKSQEINFTLYYNGHKGIDIESDDSVTDVNKLVIPFHSKYKLKENQTNFLFNQLKTQLDTSMDYKFYVYLKDKFKYKKSDGEIQYPCLLSGLKFGGLYNLYTKDPLTIHSKYIVKKFIENENQSFPLVQLQSDIRLGSSTKKEVLTTFLNPKTHNFESYSFQWAGF